MIRTGIGYDIHRFEAGRPLVLGGIEIPFERGLHGHSDADVLLHAIADAVLGAGALGDIGHLFPPADASTAGIDSRIILANCAQMTRDAGFQLVNVDATVIAEAPRLAPHILEIRRSIAGTLSIPTSAVSVKATTNEQLGALGRSEGIAALAIATVHSERGESDR